MNALCITGTVYQQPNTQTDLMGTSGEPDSHFWDTSSLLRGTSGVTTLNDLKSCNSRGLGQRCCSIVFPRSVGFKPKLFLTSGCNWPFSTGRWDQCPEVVYLFCRKALDIQWWVVVVRIWTVAFLYSCNLLILLFFWNLLILNGLWWLNQLRYVVYSTVRTNTFIKE